MKTRHLAAIIPLAGALCLAPPAHAVLNLSFSTVTDTAAAIPDGGGSFTAFPADPAQSFAVTAFTGSGDSGQQGVYACDRTQPVDPCRILADTASAIPGGIGDFTRFLAGPGISGDQVAFLGSGAGGEQGVYACDRTAPTDPCRVLADTASAIPGGIGDFTGFLAGPGISGNQVAFLGSGDSGQQGIYACGPLGSDPAAPTDPCRVLADTLTEIPGGELHRLHAL
jgi:hypothetical protein